MSLFDLWLESPSLMYCCSKGVSVPFANGVFAAEIEAHEREVQFNHLLLIQLE